MKRPANTQGFPSTFPLGLVLCGARCLRQADRCRPHLPRLSPQDVRVGGAGVEEEIQRETNTACQGSTPHSGKGSSHRKDSLAVKAHVCASPETRNPSPWKACFHLVSKKEAWGVFQNVLKWALGSRTRISLRGESGQTWIRTRVPQKPYDLRQVIHSLSISVSSPVR